MRILPLTTILILSSLLVEAKQDSADTECLPSSIENDEFHCFVAPDLATACANNHELCQEWGHRGECKANPIYMHKHCRKECKTCLNIFRDAVTQVAPPQYKEQIYHKLLQTGTYINEISQSKDQYRLASCVNRDEHCTLWAVEGKCQHEKDRMQKECPAACQFCR